MKRILTAFALCFTAGLCMAQTAPTTGGVSFGITTSAADVRLGGQNIPIADATADISIVNSKSLGAFFLSGDMFTSTDKTLTGYFGGLKWTPKIDDLLGKTTLPVNTFQVSLDAEPGIVTNATGRNALGGFAVARLDYDPSSTGHFAVNLLRVGYISASGIASKPNGLIIGGGVSVFFGGTK